MAIILIVLGGITALIVIFVWIVKRHPQKKGMPEIKKGELEEAEAHRIMKELSKPHTTRCAACGKFIKKHLMVCPSHLTKAEAHQSCPECGGHGYIDKLGQDELCEECAGDGYLPIVEKSEAVNGK